jgi:hypothetical protein
MSGNTSSEWSWTLPHSSFFAPLEAEIRTSFLPALLGIPPLEIDGEYRQILTHGVKQGGLAIRNPVDIAPSIHLDSLVITRHLMVSLVDAMTLFNIGTHLKCATEAGQSWTSIVLSFSKKRSVLILLAIHWGGVMMQLLVQPLHQTSTRK